ncbi:MAG TPA: glycerol-3-phosphate 1-O-acyltransferase PlsY [Steroidobacteraceae bacterium]|nr:glycerol-3-phosphate 1-O-acyltransferase PlsY [Steroidobacteraceae bacterium]
MLELGFKTLVAYLIGSVIGSLVVGRIRGGIDIRSLGSGNAGGTNALRTQGVAFALWVVLIDVGKGVLAAGLLPGLALPGIPASPEVDREWLAVICGSAAVVGHVYPVWYGFRGGKGAATVIGALLGIDALLLLPVVIVWLVTVMLSGYVGLGTMLAAASVPVYLLLFAPQTSLPVLAFSVAMALFIAYTHRSNIARMRAGTENRAQRLWLLRPR